LCAAILCAGCAPESIDPHSWTREETVWTSGSGSQVALYSYGMAVGKAAEALVCEQRDHRDAIQRLPADSFVLAEGNELKVIRQSDSTLPGWYRISKTPHLSWWDRTFSSKTLGRWEVAGNQASLPKPSDLESRNAVLSFDGTHWRKLADESRLKDLFDVPADGLVYVGEPGVGVLQTIDLSRRCP
jgi:hypothetical protein